ncbi:MAG: ribosome small subunit-dependent GTPase A [Spirochaetales bacterium]|nr:ribosome small subunit-dependent GTPase A [Spirochaetales bacterium]
MNKDDKIVNKNKNSWGFFPQADLEFCESEGLFFGRIIRENRGQYLIASGDSIYDGEVSGAFRYKAICPADYPGVGDWVAFREITNPIIIEKVLTRKSSFSRKTAGIKTEEQIIAANVDYIFLVFAINGGRNFTASGLERYLIMAWDSGALPVVVLNKSDLCNEEERESALLTAEASTPGVDIKLVSAETGEGLDDLLVNIPPESTLALVGPSGVGKSSLINALSGKTLQKTHAQRETDLRGRHTTTHRELFRLETGHLLIDTPGMRELQLWGDSDSANNTFSDIAEIANNCKFSDCRHEGEPGCAVQKALAEGFLEYRRFENYLDLRRELDYLQRKKDEKSTGKDQKKWKDISKEIRRYYKEKNQ